MVHAGFMTIGKINCRAEQWKSRGSTLALFIFSLTKKISY